MRHKIVGNKDDVAKAIENCIVGYKSLRNREIIKDHYIDGMTFEELAEKYKMSVSQIKKISYDNEKLVVEYLAENKSIIGR